MFALLKAGVEGGEGHGEGGRGEDGAGEGRGGEGANEGLGYKAREAERGQPEVEAMIISHLQQARLGGPCVGPGYRRGKTRGGEESCWVTHGESGGGVGEGGDVSGYARQG